MAIGDGAVLWLKEAGAAGASRVRAKMAAAVALAKLSGVEAVNWALGTPRFTAASPSATWPRSWLTAQPRRRSPGPRQRGPQLRAGTNAWKEFG